MLLKSIRWRLQIWLAILLGCILSGFGFTAYQLQRTNRLSQIDDELHRRVAALNSDVRGPGRPGTFSGDRFPFEGRGGSGPMDGPGSDRRLEPDQGPPDLPPPDFGPRGPAPARFNRPDTRVLQLSAETASRFSGTNANDFYYCVWSTSGTVMGQAPNAPSGLALPRLLDADSRIHTRMNGERREAVQFTELGDCVLVGRNISTDLKAMHRLAGWLAAAGAGILALGLGGGWWLAGRAIRPVEQISATASRISGGNLAERINLSETDSELGRLGSVLNSTFARLETAFAQQKQFAADASHELRTPLTVLISEAQTALARERGAAEYRETLEACLDTAQEMRELAQSLLELARFDAGQELIQRVPVDLADCARTAIEFIRPLAEKRQLQIHCDLHPAEIAGDPARLKQLMTNLLTNAIHYNRDHGSILVGTRKAAGATILTVTDTGIGIEASDLPHLFGRFYRCDKSRHSGQGRTGLGLAICKAIAEAHGGVIEVESQPAAGSRFTVRFG